MNVDELSLYDLVNLIRSEIARTEVGDVKRITGPAGEQGPQGETGPHRPARAKG